jgi:hypothetical protein
MLAEIPAKAYLLRKRALSARLRLRF